MTMHAVHICEGFFLGQLFLFGFHGGGKTAGAKLSTHTDLYQAQVTLLPVFRAGEPLVGSQSDGFN